MYKNLINQYYRRTKHYQLGPGHAASRLAVGGNVAVTVLDATAADLHNVSTAGKTFPQLQSQQFIPMLNEESNLPIKIEPRYSIESYGHTVRCASNNL